MVGNLESNKNKKNSRRWKSYTEHKANTKASRDTYDDKDAEEHQVKVWFIFLLLYFLLWEETLTI